MFGSGNYGILGIGNEKPVSYENPVEVTYFTENNIHIKDVALGEQHSVFLSDKGKVYTCGFGGNTGILSFLQFGKAGALGHGNKTHLGLPKKVAYFEKHNIEIKQISAGRYHTVALSTKGQVFTWGRGSYGVLGNGSSSSMMSPVLLDSFGDSQEKGTNGEIVKIDSANNFTGVLTKAGDILTWGENEYGQMGTGSNIVLSMVESEDLPTKISFGESKEEIKIKDFACGNRTMILLDKDENVYKTGMRFDYSPKKIEVPKDFKVGKVKRVFCGDDHHTILYGTVRRECRQQCAGGLWNADQNGGEKHAGKAVPRQRIVPWQNTRHQR
eukprot:TRINITY_DN4360_c0_g2_i8.p1 TRINITY_DN4360_c0_g2~~TRINITY_DN4360_c0_g2_i8.p1  ORF type:complete len:327 (-),score=43.35 TRINITY_DN4360_c0_g2_i8:164-1144(-)